MRKNFLGAVVMILLVILGLPLTVSAEMLDKYADPPVVVSSGSFEATYKTHLDFSLSGGTLTSAQWTLIPMYAIYSPSGTIKEGETVSLSLTGTQHAIADENLVFNNLNMKLTFFDGNDKVIGDEQTYSSGNVKNSPLSQQIGASVPVGAKKAVINGTFKSRWSTSVVAEEGVAVLVTLMVEEDTGAGLPVESGTTQSSNSGSDWASDDYGSDSEGFPLGIVIAVIGGLLIIGLGIGGLMRISKPQAAPGAEPNDVIITDPATGAQTRYVEDPETGEWVDPQRGSLLRPEQLPEWIKQRQADRKWVDHENEKLQTGNNAFDRKLAQEQAIQQAINNQIDELLRVSQRAGAQPQSELTFNIRKNAQKLVDKLIVGTEPVSPEAIERVRGAFIKTATGTIMTHAELPRVPSDSMLYVAAFNNQLEEVSRNQTITAVLFRTAFAFSTLGGSELFFQTHKGYLRMRDYVDAGGNDEWGAFYTASWGAAKDFAVSKAADAALKPLKISGNKWDRAIIKKADKLTGRVESSWTNSNKILYNQAKRLVKGDINTTDRATLDIDGKVRRAIKQKFK
jgi:hypothetical protein